MKDSVPGDVSHFDAPQCQLIVVARVPISGQRMLGQAFIAGVEPVRLLSVRVLEGDAHATIVGVFVPALWRPGTKRVSGDALILPSAPLIVNFIPTDAAIALAKQMGLESIHATIVVDFEP